MAGSTKGELLTVAEASIELGVSLKTCYRWINESKKLKAYRVPCLAGRGGAIFEVPVEEVLKHKRVSVNCKENKKKWVSDYKKGATLQELATKYRSSPTTIRNHLTKMDVPRRHDYLWTKNPRMKGRKYNYEFIVSEYVDNRKSSVEIANNLNASPTVVYMILRRMGVEMRPYRNAKRKTSHAPSYRQSIKRTTCP